jgi:hypothetical protein
MSRARDLGSSINSTAAGKNLVINGNFEISQRTSSPETATLCGAGTYFLDRWTPHQYQSAIVSRVAVTSGSGPTSRYALRIGSVTTAQEAWGSRMVIAQKVESLNTYKVRGQRVTLSFWVRFSNSNFTSIANTTDSTYGNFSYLIGYHTTTTDAATGTTGIDSQNWSEILNTNSTGSLPTSWTKITLNGTVPTNANNILVRFGFNALGSSTTQGQYWYEIADVQLETGSSATAFSLSFGDIQGELAKCHRYYWRETGFQSSGGSQSAFDNNVWFSLQTFNPVPMRATPTPAIESTPYIMDFASNLRSITSVNVITRYAVGLAYSGNKLTTGDSYGVNFSDSGRALSFNAEI